MFGKFLPGINAFMPNYLFRSVSRIAVIHYMASSVTRKNRQMSIKLAQNDFTRKMRDFDTFTKIP